jgi:hypothetical protein
LINFFFCMTGTPQVARDSPVPLYLYVYYDERLQNQKLMRIFSCPTLQITVCRSSCPYCTALVVASKSLPPSWQKKLTHSRTDASNCGKLHCTDTDEWITLRNRSADARIMRNALSTKFKPKKQHFVPQTHQKDLKRCVENDQQHLLVAWDMGSGKTAGAAFALTNYERVAVVCEKTLIDYWVAAFTTMGVRPGVDVWHVAVRSYETIAQALYDHPRTMSKTAVVVDEVQHYKNYHSATGGDMSAVVEALASVAASQMPLLLLTGTPLLNNALDITYLLRILASDSPLTVHMDRLEEELNVPRDEKSAVAMPLIVKNYKGGKGKVYRDFYEALKNKIHYFSPAVYEAKSFGKHYPTLNETAPVLVKLTWEQCLVYFYNNDGMHININGLVVTSSGSKGGVMRQLAVTSSAVLGDRYFSSKTAAIVKSIVENANTKHVVYSGLKERSLKPVRDLLQVEHPSLRVELLDGTVTGEGLRQKMMQDYIDGKLDVLLICRVGAVGLDLRGTSIIHLMESQSNTATERQIFARAIRFSTKAPDPAVVEARRYIGTFPSPNDPVDAGTRATIDAWLATQPATIRKAFGGDSKSVVRWLHKRISERKITMDEQQFGSNAAKDEEIAPLMYLLRAASVYTLLDEQTRQLPNLFMGNALEPVVFITQKQRKKNKKDARLEPKTKKEKKEKKTKNANEATKELKKKKDKKGTKKEKKIEKKDKKGTKKENKIEKTDKKDTKEEKKEKKDKKDTNEEKKEKKDKKDTNEEKKETKDKNTNKGTKEEKKENKYTKEKIDTKEKNQNNKNKYEKPVTKDEPSQSKTKKRKRSSNE